MRIIIEDRCLEICNICESNTRCIDIIQCPEISEKCLDNLIRPSLLLSDSYSIALGGW